LSFFGETGLADSKQMLPVGGLQVVAIAPKLANLGSLRKRCPKATKAEDNFDEALQVAIAFHDSCKQVLASIATMDTKAHLRITILGNLIQTELETSHYLSIAVVVEVDVAFGKLCKDAAQAAKKDDFHIVASVEAEAWGEAELLKKCKSQSAKKLRSSWKEGQRLVSLWTGLQDKILQSMPSQDKKLQELASKSSHANDEDWKFINQTVMTCLAVQTVLSKADDEIAKAKKLVETKGLLSTMVGASGSALPAKFGLAWGNAVTVAEQTVSKLEQAT
jgi:hypothetical protein